MGEQMATNSFRSKKYEDFEILDGGSKVIGQVRVKPNAVLWSPKGQQSWYSVNLEDFADFAVGKGKKQKK